MNSWGQEQCFRFFGAMLFYKKNQTVRAKKLMKEKEKGCIEPLYGEKSKCILKIVPQTEKCDSFQIDKKCIKQKV